MKNAIQLILVILISGTWGYFQLDLFPYEEYGMLFIFPSIAGGFVIGVLGSKIREMLD